MSHSGLLGPCFSSMISSLWNLCICSKRQKVVADGVCLPEHTQIQFFLGKPQNFDHSNYVEDHGGRGILQRGARKTCCEHLNGLKVRHALK